MERVLLIFFLIALTTTNATIDITKLNLLPGWNAQLVSTSVPDIRQMALTPDETVIFAGSSLSNVYAVPITIQNNLVTQNGEVIILLKNQTWPHGVAFDPTTNDLYVSLNYTSIFKFPNIVSNLNSSQPPVLIFDKFVNSTAYPCKHLRFNKDYSRIYTSQGSPCDHCIIQYSVSPPDYSATIVSILKNGSDPLIHAFGIRNDVGLTFNPNGNNDLWFTDCNRNGLGNNIPPSELNQLPNASQASSSPPNYGFPYCYGKNYSDTSENGTCLSSYIPAQYLIQTHSLPLGLTFVNNTFSEGTVLIAERGSASVPFVGLRVVMFNVNDPASTETVFIDGWLQNSSTVLGRPVDVVQMKDGSILVSDETAGAIIRFYYTPPSPSGVPTTVPTMPTTMPTMPTTMPTVPTVPSYTPSGCKGVSSLQNWLLLVVCAMSILTFVLQ